jgi:hypothetical protein
VTIDRVSFLSGDVLSAPVTISTPTSLNAPTELVVPKSIPSALPMKIYDYYNVSNFNSEDEQFLQQSQYIYHLN